MSGKWYVFKCENKRCNNVDYPRSMYPPGTVCDICDRGEMKRISLPERFKGKN